MKQAVVAVIAALVLLTGCGSDESAEEPDATVPQGFTAPAGVELTPGGTTLKIGEPATVVFETGDGAASAITATPTKVKRGEMKDFKFFSLDAESKASTPYYVTATVTNDGPAGLGGVGAPFVAHDSSDMIVAPNVINGEFKPCENGQLPAKFLPGDTAELCMVFLMPKDRKLVSIDAVSDEPATAVRWKP